MNKKRNKLLSLAMVLIMLLSTIVPSVVFADPPTPVGSNLVTTGDVQIDSLVIKSSGGSSIGESGDDVLGNGNLLRAEFEWSAHGRERLEVGEWFAIGVDFGEFTPKTTSLMSAEINLAGGGQLILTWEAVDAAAGTYIIRLTVSETITGGKGSIDGTGYTEFFYSTHKDKAGDTVTWNFGSYVFKFTEGEYPSGYWDYTEGEGVRKDGMSLSGQNYIVWAMGINETTGTLSGDIRIVDKTKDKWGNAPANTHKITPLREMNPKFDDNPTYAYSAFERPLFGSAISAPLSTGDGYFDKNGLKSDVPYFRIYEVTRSSLKEIWESNFNEWIEGMTPNPIYDPDLTSPSFVGALFGTAAWEPWLSTAAAGTHYPNTPPNYPWHVGGMQDIAAKFTPVSDAAVKSVTIDSDDFGFEIVLDGDLLSDKEIFIVYCTEMLPGQTRFGNMVDVTVGGTELDWDTSYVTVTSSGGTLNASNDGIVLRKVDENSTLINKNANFTITRYVDGSITPNTEQGPWNVSTGTTGQVSVPDLYPDNGYYYKLEETATPDGYNGLTVPIYFKLTGTSSNRQLALGTVINGNFTANDNAYPGVATAAASTRVLTVVNELMSTEPDPVSATIRASKAVTGEGAPELTDVAGQFSFQLYNDEGFPIADATATNVANGAITFPSLMYFVEDTHTYTIKETSGSGPWIYSEAEHTVTVTVTKNGDNELEAVIEYPGDSPDVPPTFTNEYNPASTSAAFKAKKITTGIEIGSRTFTFGLYAADDNTFSTPLGRIVLNDGDEVTFPEQTYTTTGEYNYFIKETVTPISGENWDFDETVYKVKVTVTLNSATDKLERTITYTDIEGEVIATDVPTFTNAFTPKPASVVLRAEKDIKNPNIDIANAKFSFSLYDEEGELLETVQNNTNGEITFTEIEDLNEAKEYKFTIKENALPIEWAGQGTWDTDTTEYEVTVTVGLTDAGTAYEVKSTAYNGETKAKFENELTPAPVTATIRAKKTLDSIGRGLDELSFEFGLFTLDNSTTPIQTAESNALGEVTFKGIEYTEIGETTYIIRELTRFIPGRGTWDFDENFYSATVKVTLGSTYDHLVASVTYQNTDAVPSNFVNKFTPDPVDVVLQANKRVEGAYMAVGQFTFGLYDAKSGKLIQSATNGYTGSISPIVFDRMTFREEGTFTFTITELTTSIPSAGTWLFDTAQYTATVTVKLNNDKDAFEATVEYSGLTTGTSATAPTFVNRFIPPPETPDSEGTTPVTPDPEGTTPVTPDPEGTTGPDETTEPEVTTTPEETITNPEETTTPEEEQLPRYTRSQVPDPNDPNSPEQFVLVNGLGVPLGTFTKVQQPDGSYLYIDLDGVPLGAGTPATGDDVLKLVISILLSASVIGMIAFLTYTQKQKAKRRKI